MFFFAEFKLPVLKWETDTFSMEIAWVIVQLVVLFGAYGIFVRVSINPYTVEKY